MKKLIILTFMFVWFQNGSAFAAVQIDINGLVCDFCAQALEKVFGKTDAVKDIEVNLDTKIVTIHFKEGQTLDDAVITTLINDAGYSVQEIRHDE